MRPILSRVLAVSGGAALTFALLPAGTAAAASSASCPAASSTRLFTGALLGSGDNKLWVYSPTASQTIVCFDFYPTLALGGGAIVVDSGVALAPPTVTVGSDAAKCTTEVVRISDPVPFRLALGTAGNTVCFTVNSSTTTLTFGGPSVTSVPSVQVWKDATYSWLAIAACPVEYAQWTLAGGPFGPCLNSNTRIV